MKNNSELQEDVQNALKWEPFLHAAEIGVSVKDGNKTDVKDGDVVVVPAGSTHNIINSGSEVDLKMYTIYSPPHHQDGIVRKTKAIAEAVLESYDGVTTE